MQAVGVGLDDVATGDLDGADAAVVRTLRSGVVVALDRPAERTALLEEGVLLLDAEPRLSWSANFSATAAQQRAGVGRVRLDRLGQQHLAQHEDVVAAADRIRAGEHRLEHAVGVVARRLVGGGTVEAPDAGLLAVLDDLGLGPHQRHRFRAVDPDVFSPYATAIHLRVVPWSRRSGPCPWSSRTVEPGPGTRRSGQTLSHRPDRPRRCRGQFRTRCPIVNGV